MSQSVNAAIVGFGRWGQLLFDASKHCPNLQIKSAVTRTPAKVSELCQQQGLALSDDLNSVLEDTNIDALIIATPHSQHYDQLIRAAAAGKHVYCEKPFTLNGDQARSALNALAENQCRVAIGHNRRFAPNTLAMKQMVADGWFGDLIHVDGVFNANMSQAKGRWRDDVSESPAGGMTSLGIHVVDMFINLMGPVSRLSARSAKVAAQCAFDDHTTASLVFENRAGGHLTTLTSTAMQWRITLYGSKGWAELQNLDTLIKQPLDGDIENIHFPGYEYPAIQTITDALSSFANDIQGNDPFPVTPDQIEHGTRVLEAIIHSSSSNQSVNL